MNSADYPTALGFSGRLASAFMNSPLTPLLALVALLMGLFATLVTPREEEPQIDVTMANVMVPFPGASARDVENLVAIPGEQVLSRLQGVEHVYAVSKPGGAVLTVQFEAGVPFQTAVVRLYDTLHSHGDWLPEHLGVGTPMVKPKGIDDVPILGLTLWTADPERAAFDLQKVAHSLETELKRIPGTRDVSTLGAVDHVVRVTLDPAKMNAYGLTVQDLKAVLQWSNVHNLSGSLVTGNIDIPVFAGNMLQSPDDVRQMVVAVRGTGRERKPVLLEDVADVTEGPDQPVRSVSIGFGVAEPKAGKRQGELFPAVTLQVSKKTGVNAADVAEGALARVEELKGQVIPDGVEITVTRNYGQTATEKAQQLIGKLVFATAFVVLLVLFALGRREALIVGVAVTLTLAATLFASWAWGFTLNRVSLFALIFSIGILVDDAIVVVENIHRWQALHPDKGLMELIPRAVDEVGGPTILATFTVIAALLPMAFVSGLMGPYMSPIPINSSLGMFISLAVAFVVTPWLALRLMKGHHSGTAVVSTFDARLSRFFNTALPRFLDPVVGKTWRRRLWAAILALIAGSLALAMVQWVVLKMLPFDNKSEFQVVLDMPVGTPMEQTARVLADIGEFVAATPEVTDYQTYAGTASPINFNGLVRQYYLRTAPEQGDIQVNLLPKSKRKRSSHQIAVAVRPQINEIARRHGGNAKVVEVPPGPPVLAPIVAEIYGPDVGHQRQVAKWVRSQFERTADILDVDDSVDADAQKLLLSVRVNKAGLLGVSVADINETVRAALTGLDVTPLHESGAKFALPVRIAMAPEERGTLDRLLQLKVRSREGALVALSEVMEARYAEREKTLYRKDLLPVVYVVGDMGGRLDSPLYGMFAMRDPLMASELPQGGHLQEKFIEAPQDPYASFSLKWDGEWQVTYETFRDMGLAYAVGLILIYLLVVAHFRSYLVPLVIMAPIPLTLIGVMPGHALFGAQFTATSMIGMIALAGIIVRNSILLVDFVREQVAAGKPFREAIIQSAVVRSKPIGLTALSAMLGALFILDDPIFNGLAISLIFGILVSTLLTLVVIPVLYFAAFQHQFKESST